MKKLIIASLLILSATVTTQADVLIYRGTIGVRGDLNLSTTAMTRAGVYVVVNYDTNEYALVEFGRFQGKLTVSQSPVITGKGGQAPLVGGRVGSFVSLALASQLGSEFQNTLQLLHGTNASILVRNSPPLVVSRPRLLQGLFANAASYTATQSYFEGHLTAVLLSQMTLAANNAGKSVNDVLDNLVVALQNAGYQ